MLTLYDYFRSSACFRVRIALNIKKLDYEMISIHLLKEGGEQFSDAYQTINPHSRVPALKDNDMIFTQSLAIIDYLESICPTPSLFPDKMSHRIWAKSFALSIAADIHPLNNSSVIKYLTQTLHISDEQKNQWYEHWIAQGLNALEKQINQWKIAEEFCFGSQPTIADICLVLQLFNARRFNCDITAYPTLVRIDENCQKHPAFLKAWPKEAVL